MVYRSDELLYRPDDIFAFLHNALVDIGENSDE